MIIILPPTYLVYGQKYQILNGYQNFSGGYLVASVDGCPPNGEAMGNDDVSMHCVSTIVYPELWDYHKHLFGTVWTILSATGKEGPVLLNDTIYLRAGFVVGQQKVAPDAEGGYLDTRGKGCQGNHLCVSTRANSNRNLGTASWSIVINEPGGGVLSAGVIERGAEVHLQNGWDNWQGGFLETRGEGCTGNKLCVSTRKEWNGGDALSQTWKFVTPGQFT
ncbi:MAG: hypothetical protein LH606_03635 [Cytophagaceae bacterium]|nr:hypothetical protein [Cytophagaceae bacterium]